MTDSLLMYVVGKIVIIVYNSLKVKDNSNTTIMMISIWSRDQGSGFPPMVWSP